MGRNFREMLDSQWERGRFVCVGLDPDIGKIPESARMSGVRDTILNFNRAIIDATKDIVSTYKPNSAFYEEHGDEGWDALRATIRYILDGVPRVPVILDAKRADIGNTNASYARSAFDHLQADAITVNPYLGGEPLAPFFERAEKGVIVLCHTSNPGAGEIQNLNVDGEPLYKVVARLASTEWNAQGNCCVMVGATYPEELGEVRAIVGDMPILVAGIGAQDGHLEKTIQAGIDGRKRGIIVNASRSIIYASRESDFAEAARKKTQELDAAIRKVL
ncbi:MAG: orotidine-5'-phosphate decarboxylase [Patescibacteria group bacterium]|nr:orotidine-5'-phosphate decarboxylase [Patescibacteria group bacterium]